MQTIRSAIVNLQVNQLRSSPAVAKGARMVAVVVRSYWMIHATDPDVAPLM
jgi:hypothetical protein